jgi:protein-S-isoprenylcysteine O-methyltransferase Ste14
MWLIDMAGLKLKVPPVAQGIIALFLIWLSSRFWPVYRIEINYKNAVSLGILLLGTVVGGLGVSAFIRLRTTVDPRYPDKANRLVVIGIYKFSRNPMYLAILLVLTGVAVYLGALSSLLVIFLFIVYINRYQIVPEEQLLVQKFGDNYRQYAERVRRWI